MGRIATYLEKPDSLFLFGQGRKKSVSMSGKQRRKFFLFFGGILLQTLVLLLLAPLFLALGMPMGIYILFVPVALKALVFPWKVRYLQEGLDWKSLVPTKRDANSRYTQFLLSLRMLRGISKYVKRRAYLDFLTNRLSKNKRKFGTISSYVLI